MVTSNIVMFDTTLKERLYTVCTIKLIDSFAISLSVAYDEGHSSVML